MGLLLLAAAPVLRRGIAPSGATSGALGKKICLQIQEMWEMLVLSLGQENPLEEEMATHPSTLAWEVSQTEEPGGLESMVSQSWT